jgi:hypothetical protein
VVSALALVFGLGALVVAHHPRSFSAVQRAAWLLTGLTFTLMASNAILHNASAVLAFFSGPGTPVYKEYLRWSPAGNYSRIFLVLAYAGALVFLPRIWSSARGRFQPLSLALMLLAMGVGGLVGWMEGPYVAGKHWTAFAVLNALGLVVLLGALLGALFTHSMDRLLWGCVGIYALHEAFNVIWHSALAWIRVPGAWAPNPAQIQVYAALTYLAMLGLALRRLLLARRGVYVPALLEPLERKLFSTID